MLKNKTILISAVVIVLVVIAAGAFFLMGRSNKSTPTSAQTANTQNKPQKMSTFRKTLADFFSMGGSQECTFSNKTNNSAGTVYVGSGKMRGDFQSQANGAAVASHMINDGTYVYVWTDGHQNGYKMSVAAMKALSAKYGMVKNPQASSQAMNVNQQATYTCGSWSVDESMFSVPQTVTFTDYSAMMQGSGAVSVPSGAAMPGTGAQGTKTECAMCNRAPAGPARNECLSALKCQ